MWKEVYVYYELIKHRGGERERERERERQRHSERVERGRESA